MHQAPVCICGDSVVLDIDPKNVIRLALELSVLEAHKGDGSVVYELLQIFHHHRVFFLDMAEQ